MAAQVSTDRQVAGLKPRETGYEISIASSRGLSVRVFPNGTKSFEFRYTAANGARRRHPLGLYPDLSLVEARNKAGALRVAVTEGGDPAAERAAAIAKARIGETLNELAETYWKAAEVGLHGGRKQPKRPVTLKKERQAWRNHVEATLGRRRYTDVRRAELKAFMRALVMDSGLAPASIADVGALIQSVFSYAVLEEQLDANPMIGLARPLAWSSRDRMFTDQVLCVLWGDAVAASTERDAGVAREDKGARLGPLVAYAIRLLILTLARRNEIAGAQWDEFDFIARQWTIPAARAKAKHLHVVPLTDDMVAVLEAVQRLGHQSPYVFPNTGPNGGWLDPHTISRAFTRILARRKHKAGSPHDIRRTGATTLIGRYRVSRHVVSLLLGHTVKEGAAATSVYDRHSYMPEKREALEAWGRHLAALQAVEAGDGVQQVAA